MTNNKRSRLFPLLLALLLLAPVPARASILDSLLGWFSGSVETSGLSLHFNGSLTANEISLLDSDGTYATLHKVAIHWSPFALIRGEIKVSLLTVEDGDILRLPKSSSSGGGSSLPSKIDITKLEIARLTLEPPVAGTKAVLAVEASGQRSAPDQAQASLTATEIGGDGHYAVQGGIDPAGLHAKATVQEAAGGPVSRIAGVPGIGAIDLAASLDGPREALATKLTLHAGPLRAAADGTINLTARSANLTLTADAPAMSPRPDLSWQSVAVRAHVQGPFTSPEVAGSVRIATLSASGIGARLVTLDVNGNRGDVALKGQIDGLTVPGKQPDLFAAAPLTLAADVHLSQPNRPLTFSLHHPLIEASGTAQTSGVEQVRATMQLPELGPLAAAAGETLQGAASLTLEAARQGATTTASLSGTIGITGGTAPVPALVGPNGRFALAGSLNGQTVTLTHLSFDGQTLRLAANGSVAPQAVALDWNIALAKLAVIDPRVGGALEAQGHVGGTESSLTLAADLSGTISAEGQSSGPFTAHLDATGLPSSPVGQLTAHGALLDAPVNIALAGARQPDGTIQVTIREAAWKSLDAHGALALPPGKTIPIGRLQLAIGNLDDLSPLIGRKLTGAVSASLDATETQAVMAAQVQKAGIPGTASIAAATLSATITGLGATPAMDGTLSLSGISAASIAGSARLAAHGPADALALQLSADLPKLDGAPARLATAGTANVSGRSITLASLTAAWKGQNLRLLQPTRFEFTRGVDIHELRLGLAQAVIAVDGHVGSTLDLTASARDVPVSLAALVSPSLNVSGTVSAEARLTGPAAAPSGTISAKAAGLRLDTPQGRDLPPASLTATAALDGHAARIDAKLAAGASHLSLKGRAPFSTTAPLALRADGSIDLAIADAMLPPGEGAAGHVTLTADITGTAARPGGTVRARATGVRLLSPTGRALPPAAATLTATLQGTAARIDARLTAASSHVTVAGTAPFSTTQPLDLRANGRIDLALAEPLLAASGQHVAGIVTIAAGVAGTATAPRITGDATLRDGDFRDYVEGVHLRRISARIVAAGDTLRIDSFHATAGEGTVTGNGTIGIMAPGIPVNLTIAARNATPLSGGVVTATLNADLGIHGEAAGRITLGGTVFVREAVIRVPSKLPVSVKTIPVVIAGAPPVPPPKPGLSPVIAMDLTVRAPQQVFVRGRGLNAELGGTILIQGTTAAMEPKGSLRLRRGTFNLVGNTLNFDSGEIDFNGGAITNPAIHLVANSTVNGTTATLTVGGTAKEPKITLTSVPDLPQDQILALLLFHTNSGQLSPFQLASIAAGLAEISGSTSNFPNPLEGLQNALGLDQLGIGSDANGAPTVQAGRYIGRRLYVGAQESTGGSGAQGTIQYELTPGLKLNATVGAGQTTSAIGATGEANGASVGITYQLQY